MYGLEIGRLVHLADQSQLLLDTVDDRRRRAGRIASVRTCIWTAIAALASRGKKPT
jgi:hypothetical protein